MLWNLWSNLVFVKFADRERFVFQGTDKPRHLNNVDEVLSKGDYFLIDLRTGFRHFGVHDLFQLLTKLGNQVGLHLRIDRNRASIGLTNENACHDAEESVDASTEQSGLQAA